jgi:DNA-binding XRE family transcriptional regulator
MAAEKKYTPEMCDIVVNLFTQGFTQEEVCSFLGVTPWTMIEWRKKGGDMYHPEFAEAFKLAKVHQKAWWFGEGRKNLTNREFNTNLFKLYMANMFGWDEKEKERELEERALRVEKILREHGLLPSEDEK